MKNFELLTIRNLLTRIKLNKVSAKDVRASIINDHLATYKLAKGFDEDVEEMRKKFFEGKDEEIQAYDKLVNEGKLDETDPEIRKLVEDFNSSYNTLLNKEVDVKIEKLPWEGLSDALTESDIDFTVDDITTLQRMGLIKE